MSTKRALSPRLSSEERRLAIIRAALEVFAKNGFHGTTTKELAKAANVSEGLIFQHFPGKDELYAAMQEECCRTKSSEEAERVMALEPSTSTLVIMTHFLMSKMLRAPGTGNAEENALHRLMVHSFMEDGRFARQFMQHVAEELIAKIQASVEAAQRAGDLVESPVEPNLRAWFAQHFSSMLMLNQLPGKPVVEFEIPAARQLEQATWFALLGMGLKASVIQKLYNPKALALLAA